MFVQILQGSLACSRLPQSIVSAFAVQLTRPQLEGTMAQVEKIDMLHIFSLGIDGLCTRLL